MTNLGSAVNNT